MSNYSSDKKLKNVKKVYSFWGRFSSLYNAQDFITFLGRAKTIRSKAVAKIGLKKGDKVLEVACGSGKNFPYLVEGCRQRRFYSSENSRKQRKRDMTYNFTKILMTLNFYET